jgi:hypothetical protein
MRLGPASLGGPGAALTLARCRGCTLVISAAAALASLTITDVADCRIVLEVGSGGGGGGGAASSQARERAGAPRTATVDRAAASSLWLAAGQVRVHRARAVDLYTRGPGGLGADGGAPAPVLEECEGVRVAPYELVGGRDDGASSSCTSSAPWAAAPDFDWPRAGPSPHWSVLAVGDRVPPPAGPAEETPPLRCSGGGKV